MNRAYSKPALHNGEFIPLVALLMSLIALATDIMLPALPAIGSDLGVLNRNTTQYVITSIFLGLAIGQILFGPLSDSIGRRPALHAGLAVFLAGCLVSIFATNFELMILGRILQGIGAAGPRIVTVAMVRDQFEGRSMARLMSFVMSVFILVPTIAPALGQGILWVGNWRAIFVTIFAIGLISFAWFAIRQPETLPEARRRPFSPRSMGRAVLEVLRIRTALGYMIATGFIFAPFIAYLSSAQQIFQEAYRTGAMFAFWFGILSLAFGCSSLANARLVMKLGMRLLCKVAAVFITLISIIALAVALGFDGLPPFWLFVTYLFAVFLGLGLMFGNLNALAMIPLGHMAGMGATVIALVSTIISVPLGAIVGQSFDGTMYAQIGAFAFFGLATLAAVWWTGDTD